MLTYSQVSGFPVLVRTPWRNFWGTKGRRFESAQPDRTNVQVSGHAGAGAHRAEGPILGTFGNIAARLVTACALVGLALGVAPASAAGPCVDPDPAYAQAVASTVAEVSPGHTASTFKASRSGDYRAVYFMSAAITGPDIAGRRIATWSVSKSVGANHGLTFAIDRNALQFTDFPNGAETSFEVQRGDDGYAKSRSCVRKAR